jgi:hypothetical protein
MGHKIVLGEAMGSANTIVARLMASSPVRRICGSGERWRLDIDHRVANSGG